MATISKTTKYIEAVGRRKTSVARIRLQPSSKGSLSINEKTAEVYFPTKELRNKSTDLIEQYKEAGAFAITAHIKGGGISSQSEAFRQALARALVKADESLKPAIKKEGLLTRDAREKERRKFGLKKARKSPQWSKR